MKTLAVVARLTHVLPPRFVGRLHPLGRGISELGPSLWSLYHGLFHRDLDLMLRVLIDELPGETAVTEEFAAQSDCQWACVFASCQETGGLRHDSLLVQRAIPMDATGGDSPQPGWPQQKWLVVAVVDMKGTPPDWNKIERAQPLNPAFRLARRKAGAVPDGAGQSAALVRRDEGRIGIYTVRLPQQSLHYVSAPWGEDGHRHFYCTCSPVEEAESPHCPHAEALRLYLAEQQARATRRQEQGLAYSGLRLEGVDQVFVLVWEGGLPTLLDPQPSQQLANHSPDGFNWGYAGSGPAQLALAMLLDYCGDEEQAIRLYQRFKTQCIATLPQDGTPWHLESVQIATFLQSNGFPGGHTQTSGGE